VDGLEELHLPGRGVDEPYLRAALARLLRAWCVRHPGGYCQGVNFTGMVLLAVMHHGGGLWGEDGARRAEESAFWTFVAVMELILPSDFHAHPGMPGLQRDVRCLFHLFLLQRRAGGLPRPSSTDERPVGEDEWRDILRLAAYRWFVPCFVNCLPLPALLLYWDRLFLRMPEPSASGGTPREPGLTSSHLQLALALLHASLEEAGDAVAAARPEEGLGLGFDRLLRGALANTDGERLVNKAAHFEVTPRQLRYLRTRLLADKAVAKGASAGRTEQRGPAPEPTLSGLQTAALRLMSVRRSESMALWVLKQTLLLDPPQPLPLAALSYVRAYYYPRLVSSCALTFCAFCLYSSRAVLGRG
jgi:hypothetical protein